MERKGHTMGHLEVVFHLLVEGIDNNYQGHNTVDSYHEVGGHLNRLCEE